MNLTTTFFRSFLAISIIMLNGCASVMQGSTQQININAYDARTNASVPANCIVSNDNGVYRTPSNRSSIIKKDKDLTKIDCQTDTMEGTTIIDGEINLAYTAADFFLIDLCIISCWVDGFSGSWVELPTMIDVPMDMKRGIAPAASVDTKVQ